VSRTLPLTVLAWEGPQARAYLVRMQRAGLRPQRIVLMVRDPLAAKLGRSNARANPLLMKWGERDQDKAHNFHPYRIRKNHPELVRTIADAMEAVVDDPMAFYADMYEGFSYDSYADEVFRVAANSYKDPNLVAALEPLGPSTIIFTGGGIVPPSVFAIEGIRLIHVHTGFLPYVRGADVLLWSLLVRGRPGVSAFFMTPGLDDGDVLAARELEPLVIPLAEGDRVDDDTLYRALFSFIDPVIRADLLVADVLEPAGDLAQLSAVPQDLSVGITYHFMHPNVRSRGLRALFPAAPPRAAAAGSATAAPSPARYQRYYEKQSLVAPVRFAVDALRAGSSLRARSIQNRQKDYAALGGDPKRLKLHYELNRQLALQAEQWDSYDYGEGYFYQSSDELGITGLRDTTGRVEAFGLKELVKGRTVLEIGCNTGFLSLAIAPAAERVVAFELNPYLIAIANLGKEYLGIDNVEFSVAAFEDFECDEQFDDVLSFANHHTYDGNTRQSLEEYFARCHSFTKPGGRLIFESHPPELEGNQFAKTVEIIERFYDIERSEIHDYGTFLDKGRRFIIGTKR
jgi:SAM-dependent methyltransferase